jgi:heat shock protein HslJ
MKTTKFLLLAALALCFALACSDDKELPTDESNHRQPELPQLPDTEYLIGASWKLVAFVNGADGTSKTPEPVSENNYWITFNKDGTFSAKSAVNELEGSYTINPATSTISITELGGTKINEQSDGDLFVQQLQSVQSFRVEQSSLKLYHTEKDYLLFKLNVPDGQIDYEAEGYIIDYDMCGGFLERGATTAKAYGYYIISENKADTFLTYNIPAPFDELPLAFFNGDSSYRHEKIRITYRVAEESEKVYVVCPAIYPIRYPNAKQIIITSIEKP